MPAETATRELDDLDFRLAYAQAVRVLSRTPIKSDRRSTTPPVSQHGSVRAAGIKFLSPLLAALEELRTMTPEADDYGALRATKFAYTTAADLLINAAIIAGLDGRQIPRGVASTDSEGGVRIEWVRPNKNVHLAIPATPERDGYIFHQMGAECGTELPTPELLAKWLNGID